MTQLSLASPALQIKNRVDELQRFWDQRAVMAKKWYELIRLTDDLKQENMESVIGTDPRSSFNLAAWLLTPKTWSIESFKVGLSDEEILQATSYEQMIEREIRLSIRSTRGRLNGSYIKQAIDLFVATGWIALVAAPTEPRWTINAWHPLSVFPHYAPDGSMPEVARKWVLTPRDANMMIFREGWIPPERPFSSQVIIRQWWIQTPGRTMMATLANEHLAQPLMDTMFHEMPIYCQPAGGLPDNGTIITDDKWRGEVGQSIVASVLDLQKNFNKMMTYTQQLLRDTANPKWVERTNSGSVVKASDINKRGVVWSIDQGDDIWPVQAPSVPVDIRPHNFDIRQQMQRVTFPDASFGGENFSAFFMANATDSTRQVLQPFIDTFKEGNGELITRSANLARDFGLDIGGLPIPDLPNNVSLDFTYDIIIPGDFLQRANSARILNPNYRLSQETITKTQFPEVKDAFEEQLRLTTEDVQQSEVMIAVKTVRQLHDAAAQAAVVGDAETELLLTQVADRQEAQLVGPTTPDGQTETFRDMTESLTS